MPQAFLEFSPGMALKWFRGGALPRPREDRQAESKDSIFNRIAASEGASLGSETRISSATSSPFVATRELSFFPE